MGKDNITQISSFLKNINGINYSKKKMQCISNFLALMTGKP